MTYLLNNGELRSSSLPNRKRATGSPPEKKHTIYKKKIAYSKLRVLLKKGGVMTMTMYMNENQAC
jgi:hypothetical protein